MKLNIGKSRRIAIVVAAVFSLVMGMVAMAGWVFQMDALKSLIPGAVQIKANTALSLILASMALILGLRRGSYRARYGSYFLATCVFFIGALTLGQYLLGWNLHIDELLFRDLANAYNAAPGRMSPFSAWTFVMLGVGLWFVRCRVAGWMAYVCGAQVTGVGLVSVLGYLWSASELVTDVWLPPVAVNTALAFTVLGLALLAAQSGAKAALEAETDLSSIETKLVLAMIGTIIILAISAGYTYRYIATFTEHVDRMAANQRARQILQSALTAEVRAQFAQGSDSSASGSPGAREAVATETLRLADQIDLFDHNLRNDQTVGLDKDRAAMLVWLIVTIGLSIGIFVVLMVAVRREMRRTALVRAEVIALNSRLEQRVLERTAELDEVNRRINAFMSSLAHDMRQPLISVAGFGALLDNRLESAGDSQSRKLLSRISAAMLRVDACTNALLELGQISRSDLCMETVDMKALAEDIGVVLQRREPERKVLIRVQPDMLPAKADKRLIKIALEHLISNAWKFTHLCEQAEIEIGSGRDENGIAVWRIKDNGAGFDMAFADKLFKPFQRLHGQDEFLGLGTGLAIVHAVISRHSGQVWAESKPDKGTVFYFTLGSGSAGQTARFSLFSARQDEFEARRYPAQVQ